MVFPIDPNNSNTYLPATPTIPLALLITAITNSFPMQITAVIPNLVILPPTPNTYVIGQLIRLNIPEPYGMQQANGLTGKIVQIIGLVFFVDIDSRQFDIFITPSAFEEQPATFAPAGSNNLQFTNTSTFEPFQSGTNTGN
jgi:hypothetical protein